MPLKSRDLAVTAAEAALKKKAIDVTILEVSGLTVIADYFVICSGESTTQVKAVASFIEEELAKKRLKPFGIEGAAYSHWILLDYGDVIVHVFEKETRAYYNLEKLWMDAKVLEFDEDNGNMAGEDKRAVHS
jgi:ribosome-associated protein